MKRSCMLAALALAACGPLAACGGGDQGEEATAETRAATSTAATGPAAATEDLSGVPLAPHEAGLPVFDVVVSQEEGGHGRIDVSVGSPTIPGVVRVEYVNATPRPGDVRLLRIDGDRTEEEVVAALAGVMRGRAQPTWLHQAGGPGRAAPDGSAVVTTTLRPGTHWAVDVAAGIGGRPAFESRHGLMQFTVAGEDEQWLWPEPAPRATTLDDGFRTPSLRAGRRWLELVNDGAEPHQLVFVALAPGSTLADVRRAVASPQGRRAVERRAAAATAVLEGGMRQLVRLELRRGRYALLCLASDRRGGPPHAATGMVEEVTVR